MKRPSDRALLSSNGIVRLRKIERDDLPQMFQFQLDPESNRVAATIARSASVFDAHWEKALRDPDTTPRAITSDGIFVGCISCFRMNEVYTVGYWLGREFWGRGIASRALELILCEVTLRPLHARVATHNKASLRVLQKSGFVVERIQLSPADDRYPECEEALLVLRESAAAGSPHGPNCE